MNIFEMLTQSCFPVELLPTEITGQSIFTVVIKHMSLELRILNKLFTTNLALVILSSGVRSNMSVESFLRCECIFTHWAGIRSLA